MSKINNIHSTEWIDQNRSENGWFRVYWKDVIGPQEGGATFDPEEGEELRYEWEYKNGKQIGVSKSWFPSGQLKEERIYKDGKEDGLSTHWYENGKMEYEYTYTDGILNGLSTFWYENGQKKIEATYNNWQLDGLRTYWYENGQKRKEGTFKDGIRITEKEWNEDGK